MTLVALSLHDQPGDDRELAQALAEWDGGVRLVTVHDIAGLTAALEHGRWDVLFCCWSPEFPHLMRILQDRTLHRSRHIPIIAICEAVEAEDIALAMRSGLSEVVGRPRLAQRLRTVVHHALHGTPRVISHHDVQQASSLTLVRCMLRVLPDMVWMKDPDGVYVACNPAFEQLIGRSETDLIGRSDFDLFPKEVAEFFRIHDRLAIEHNGPRSNEEWLTLASSGKRILVETTKTPVYTIDGRLLGVLGMCHDISEYRNAFNALAISESRLSQSQRLAHIGSWELDLPSGHLWWSDEIYRIFAIDPKDFSCSLDAFMATVHPEDRERVSQAYSVSVRDRSPYDVTHRIRTPDGRVKHVHEHCITEYASDGTPLRSLGTVQDISDRVEGEQRLDLLVRILGIIHESGENQGAIRQLLETIKEGTRFSAVGIRFRRGEDFPYLVEDGFPPEFVVAENSVCGRAIDGSAMLDCTCGMVLSGSVPPDSPYATANGSFFCNDTLPLLALPSERDPRHSPRNTCIHVGYRSVGIIPLRHGNRIIGSLQLNDLQPDRFTPALIQLFESIATSLGIAIARRQDLSALRRAVTAAQSASAAKSSFLSTMSHEIRTPLNGIIGLTDILRTTTLNPEQAEMVDMVQHCGNSLLAVIGDVLDLAKIEAGQTDVRLASMSPHDLIQQVISMFRVSAGGKGLTLRSELDPELPRQLVSDPALVRQILVNLMGNAVKFSDQGMILLKAAAGSPDARGRPVMIWEVIDQGRGIPEDFLPHLFEPFTQADGSHTRRHGGSGLGLAICKRLTGLLGGEISAHSRNHAGTTFRVVLPYAWVEGAHPAQIPATATLTIPPWERPPRILVVEDDESGQFTIELMLSALGCQPHVVGDGTTALRAVGERSFDLVLMDCQLPDVDGQTVTRQLRQLPALRDTPVIAITANSFSEDRERCRAAGMNDMLAKPCTLAALSASLRRWLSGLLSRP